LAELLTIMSIGFLGKKVGMTRVYNDKGEVQPVTVVHVGGNVVTQVRTIENDGYEAVQLAYDDQKGHRLAKAQQGHFKKAGAGAKKFVREFRGEAGDLVPGAELKASRFVVGQFVDVIGVSKGKGFAGIIKKHHASGQNETHGSMMHRRPGAIGMRSTPGRIWKNQSMPGHLGDDRRTVQNLRIVQVREDDGALLIRGAVPGANGSYVLVRPSKKKKTVKA
jgi:large subunit ribosomal protein L3